MVVVDGDVRGNATGVGGWRSVINDVPHGTVSV